MSFLGHLEALRWHLFRAVVVVMSLAIILFFFKEFLFDGVLLAPKTQILLLTKFSVSFLKSSISVKIFVLQQVLSF